MTIRALLLGIAIATAAVSLRAQVVDSLAGYFPLAVGNVWQYHSRFATSTNYSVPYTIVALGDTIMPNGRHYMHLSRGMFGPGSEFIRYDSTEGAFYGYEASAASAEIRIYALREWLTPPNNWGYKMKWSVFGNAAETYSISLRSAPTGTCSPMASA